MLLGFTGAQQPPLVRSAAFRGLQGGKLTAVQLRGMLELLEDALTDYRVVLGCDEAEADLEVAREDETVRSRHSLNFTLNSEKNSTPL